MSLDILDTTPMPLLVVTPLRLTWTLQLFMLAKTHVRQNVNISSFLCTVRKDETLNLGAERLQTSRGAGVRTAQRFSTPAPASFICGAFEGLPDVTSIFRSDSFA